MNPLASVFAESAGKHSTMRAAALLVVILILGPIAYVSCQTKVVQHATSEDAALIIGALGMKAWQRGKESAHRPPPTDPKPTPQ